MFHCVVERGGNGGLRTVAIGLLPLLSGPQRYGLVPHRIRTFKPARTNERPKFVAFYALEGKVIGRRLERHRHQAFILFLNAV